ncbi:MAG: hypothetical protein RLY40_27 [Pseudomonadota bacterium]|jgi:antitoxin component of RelBE/YafQ-DinJ toxin-antitoxin module
MHKINEQLTELTQALGKMTDIINEMVEIIANDYGIPVDKTEPLPEWIIEKKTIHGAEPYIFGTSFKESKDYLNYFAKSILTGQDSRLKSAVLTEDGTYLIARTDTQYSGRDLIAAPFDTNSEHYYMKVQTK